MFLCCCITVSEAFQENVESCLTGLEMIANRVEKTRVVGNMRLIQIKVNKQIYKLQGNGEKSQMDKSGWVTCLACLRVCLVIQSCRTLPHSMDCSPPGSSIHWISQARVLEWVAISSSRGSSPPRHQARISCTGRRILYQEPPFVHCCVLSMY